MDTEDAPDHAKSQKDVMSVCLAVVRGVLTPDQARAAILGRTAPVPLSESLRLSPEILRAAESLGQLPHQEKEECLAMFKELYEQPPPEEILRSDGTLAQSLIDQRLISPGQAEECLAIQARLAQAGTRPLPRLGELLLRKGHLIPGLDPSSATSRAPGRSGSDALTDRVRQEFHSGLPPVVRELLADPSNRFGRYVRTQLLGKGGIGEVWKAWDLELGRWVALKFLKFEDPEELARLKREAQTAAKLSHPNIATVYEIAEARERTFLVMEYVEGQTLETFPRHDPESLVSLLRHVSLAIHYAHTRGVIHRDIKPGNIMVDPSGRPLVMDFGLARQVGSNRSIPGVVLGTPAYMPPEQATGERADARSDVYSLGATLYELLADRPPFRGESILEILRKVTSEEPDPLLRVSPELRTIVSKSLMKEPGRRYLNAWELAEDLRRWQEGEPIQAHPPSLGYRLRKKIVKRRAILGVALAGLALATGVAVLLVPRWLGKVRELRLERENETRKEKALDQARPALDEGRKIMERLDRLLMTEDWTPESVQTLARGAHRQFDRALQASPGFPDALLEKARAYQAEGDKDLALEYCTRALTASHQYGTAYLQRARILLDRYESLRHASGQRLSPETREERDLADRIRVDLKEVEAWSTDNQEILFARGALAFVNGDYAEAGRSLQAYSQLVFSDYRGWSWTGHSWLHVPGKEDEAIRALTEAMKFRPRLAPLRVFRGFSYLHKARSLRQRGEVEASSTARDGAARDFSRAAELDPGLPEAHVGSGDTLRDRGEGGPALAEYAKAIALNPKYAVAYLRRADLLLEKGDLAGGIADADEAIRLNPKDPRGLLARAALRDGQGDFAGALQDIESVLSRDPDAPGALVRRGQVKEHERDLTGADQDYSHALELNPDFTEAYHQRGICRRKQGDSNASISDLSRALALDRGNPWTHYHRGVAYDQAGAFPEALLDFEKGLALGPSSRSKFHLRLWLARSREGDVAKGRAELSALSSPLSRGAPEDPYRVLARVLLGEMTQGDYLAALERGSWPKEQGCIGYFYLAEKSLLEGKREPAKELLEKCLATGGTGQDEYESAEKALASLRDARK